MSIFLTLCIFLCLHRSCETIKCRVGAVESCLLYRLLPLKDDCNKCRIQDILVYKDNTPTVRREYACTTKCVDDPETERNKTTYCCDTDDCNSKWPPEPDHGEPSNVRTSLCSIVHRNTAVQTENTVPHLPTFSWWSSTPNISRANLLVKAKVAERVQRFDDMAQIMKQWIEQGDYIVELSQEGQSLLFTAFKKAALSRVASWKLLSPSHMVTGQFPEVDYARNIRAEFLEIGSTFLDITDKIRNTSPECLEADFSISEVIGEFYEFYDDMGMIFIPFRFPTEKLTGAHKAESAYRWAYDVALRSVPVLDPRRLRMAVRLSTLYADRLNRTEQACNTAEPAFEKAILHLFLNNKDPNRETEAVLQLLRDKLTVWGCNPDHEEFDTMKTSQPRCNITAAPINTTNSYSCGYECGELEKKDDGQITTATNSSATAFSSSGSPPSKNGNLWMQKAKEAERAQRFNDMAYYAKKLTELNEFLSEREESLVWRAFEKAVDDMRVFRKIPFGNLTSRQVSTWKQIREVILQISNGVNRFCRKMRIVPGRKQEAIRSLFLMMRSAEFLGYVAEWGGGIDRIRHAHRAESRYDEALRFANQHCITALHPVLLGTISNFVTFLHNIRGNHEKACTIAKNGYERAKTDLARTTELQNAETVELMKTIAASMKEWKCLVGVENKDQTMLNSSSNITTIPAKTPTNDNSTSESAT